MPVQAEAEQDKDTNYPEGESDKHAKSPDGALSGHGHSQPPLTGEIPDPDTEMEGRGQDTEGHKEKEIGIGQIMLDVEVGGLAVSEPAFGIEMPADVEESDEAGIALQGVQPVLDPGIGRDVGLAAEPDVNAVEAVEKHGKKNEGPFNKETERDGLKLARNGVIFIGTDESGAVGPQMFSQKSSDWDDSRKRVEFSKQIACVRLGCRRRHALSAAEIPEDSKGTRTQGAKGMRLFQYKGVAQSEARVWRGGHKESEKMLQEMVRVKKIEEGKTDGDLRRGPRSSPRK
jgi:hypothetical protein